MAEFNSGLSQWERRLMGRKQESISSVADLIKNDENIPQVLSKNLVDKLNAATFTGDTLSTSASLADDEIEACLGAIAGKVNLIIRALKEQNIIR